MSYDYGRLETDLLDVLALLEDQFDEEEGKEVRVFIEAGEYGVAFETICSIIKEEGKSIPVLVANRLEDLGGRLGIEPDYWRDIVRSDSP